MTEANSINAATTGIVGNTGTSFTGTAVTAHNVIVGGSTSSTLTNVAPSATSGVPLVSGGSSADPSFTTAVVAGGGTGDTSFTAFAPICGGTTTTGALQSATTGLSTTGNVFTSNGSSSLPSFIATTSVGSLVLIQSQTASNSASLTFTSGITATYNNYLLIFSNVLASTGTPALELQISTNGGSTYIATGYLSGSNWSGYNGGYGTNNVNSTTYFLLNFQIQSTAAFGAAGYFTMQNFTNGSYYPLSIGMSTSGSSAPVGSVTQGAYATAVTVNAFKVLLSAGNISTGTFTLYGILE